MKALEILKRIYINNPDTRFQRNNIDINFTIHDFSNVNEAIKELEALENRSCERWLNVENFINDMYPSFIEGLTLDRINIDGNYEPNNCRWITQIENNRNGARSKITSEEAREILYLHGTYINIDIAEAYGITPSVVCNIAKGRLWPDVYKKYSTEKNKKRANPRFLKPLVNYSKGSIDFDDF